MTKTDVKAKAFADEYLANGLNATLAMQRMGIGSTPEVSAALGSRLFRNAKVRERIQERLNHAFSLPIAEPIGLLVQQMRGSVDDLLDEGGHITREALKEHGSLVKKLKTRRVIEGTGENATPVEYVEVELYSSQVAADKLCDLMGLKPDKRDDPNDSTGAGVTQAITMLVKELRQFGQFDETAARRLLADQHPDIVDGQLVGEDVR